MDPMYSQSCRFRVGDSGLEGRQMLDRSATTTHRKRILRPDPEVVSAADQTSSDADQASATADIAATGRDEAAADREIASTARDSAAMARDWAAEERVFAQGPGGPEYEAAVRHAATVRAQAAADRKRAAADRHEATRDRTAATIDRARAAKDRFLAAMDREQAAMDRRQALAELDRAHTDDLTGAHRRGAGEAALQGELERARRAGHGLVLAFVDVDDLKATNDHGGHAAGDARLRDVVNAMRSKIRSYEPIVRYGGDEFLCSFGGVGIADVRARFTEIETTLSDGNQSGSMSVGLAELESDDTLQELINRADKALIKKR
jgi:diguanylate cyclase (GGDEF)-like protein